MNFELTEEQRLIQDTAQRFAAEQIAPTLEEEERKHEFRADRVAKMGGLGFFSCALPEELGGSGMGFMESVLMSEQISRVSASWRLPFNMQNLGPALTVAKFGSEALLYTVPIVAYGIFRYLYLTNASEKSEDPSQVLLTDRPMGVCVLLYLAVVVLVLYRR